MSNTKPLLVTEVVLTNFTLDGRVYHVAQARGQTSGPCPGPMSALRRLGDIVAGVPVTEVPPNVASMAQMRWVAAGGDDVARLDPRACAITIMTAAVAVEIGNMNSREWLTASASIADRLADGHIKLADLERVNY